MQRTPLHGAWSLHDKRSRVVLLFLHWMNVILFFITKPTAYCFLRRPDSRSLSARTISVITLMDMQYERCVQANRADHTPHRQRP